MLELAKSYDVLIILAIAAIIFGIITVAFSLGTVFGQVQNVTSPPAPSPQALDHVVEQVPAITNQVDAVTMQNTVIGAAASAITAWLGGKTLKDRQDKKKIEDYGSEAIKTVFNHVVDNYNDFAVYCGFRINYLNILYENPGITEKQILDIIADPVTGKTYGHLEKEFLNGIVKANDEYYKTPAPDTQISCPDPRNKLARTMTTIKKHSIPNETNEAPKVIPTIQTNQQNSK